MRALVLGSAACLWRDLANLNALMGGPWEHTVVACNDAGAAWPGTLHHWATLHHDNMPAWMEARHRDGFDEGYTLWGGHWTATGSDDSAYPWVDDVLPVTLVGSSGMLATDVALHLGFRRLVLAGIPMDVQPHFFGGENWTSPMAHRDAWAKAAPTYGDRVRSMSGWTAELLGTPTREWLRGE